MSRYTGSSYKQARRVGSSLLENGKELARRGYKPGQHGAARRSKPSNYSVQLNEKQKVRFMYGLNERQFRKTFDEAGKMAGIHGENFLKLLESRLDNLVYRMGFANTRRGARQLVNHGHVTVNGKTYKSMAIFHPSYLLRNHSMEEGSPRRLMQEDLANIKNEVLSDVNHTFGVPSDNIFTKQLVNV